MSNDFYTRAYSPLPEQRVSSQVLKDEFARVEAGFDEVQSDADRAIKLPVGTADQTLAMDAVARANLVLAFNAAGNITAISYGRYRGDWLTATAYVISDYFRDPASKNIYSVVAAHTSGVLATDISAGRVQLAINVEDVEVAKTAAQNAATTATTQAGVATTQAGTATTQAGVAAAQASTATTQAGVATTQAGIATSAAATATTQAGIATTKAAEAAASAASIAGGPVPEAPNNGKAYARKDASWVEDLGAGIPALAGQALKNLRVKSDETGVEWTAEAAPGSMARIAKTSAYTLAGADKGALIDCTGTWTLGLTAAATLGAGWWCYVRNTGSGDITIDPNGSELIDGASTLVMKPGFIYLLQCDGVAFTTVTVKRRTYERRSLITASGTFTVPEDCFVIRAYAFGAGGNPVGSDGGGGGGCAYGDVAVVPGQVVTLGIASSIATVTASAVVLLTANPASGATGGTASKHASVTNGGAYSGGTNSSGYAAGASSGSPLGNGFNGGIYGGAGWGGKGGDTGATAGAGGGAAGAASAAVNNGGPGFDPVLKPTDPLLADLTGAGGVPSAPGGPGGGGGGGSNTLPGGNGGFGGGGGGTGLASARGGNGGFGGGGGYSSSPGGIGGNGGYGGGGGKGASTNGSGGTAAIIIIY